MQEESTPTQSRGGRRPPSRAACCARSRSLWPDHQGHARGKRVPAADFLRARRGQGFAFCDAALAWDVDGDVQDGLRLTGWETGYPRHVSPCPDLATFRRLPWRPARRQRGLRPRRPPRRAHPHRAAHGAAARGRPPRRARLQRRGRRRDRVLPARRGRRAARRRRCMRTRCRRPTSSTRSFGDLLARPARVRRLEGGNIEYGPGQVRGQPAPRDRRSRPPTRPSRFKYATRELARRAGAHGDVHGQAVQRRSRATRCTSTCRCGRTASRPSRPTGGDGERRCTARAIGGAARTTSRASRSTARRPSTRTSASRRSRSRRPRVDWGGDNRTVSIRSLVETPEATRIELRTGARRRPAALGRRRRCWPRSSPASRAGVDPGAEGRGQPLRRRRAAAARRSPSGRRGRARRRDDRRHPRRRRGARLHARSRSSSSGRRSPATVTRLGPRRATCGWSDGGDRDAPRARVPRPDTNPEALARGRGVPGAGGDLHAPRAALRARRRAHGPARLPLGGRPGAAVATRRRRSSSPPAPA